LFRSQDLSWKERNGALAMLEEMFRVGDIEPEMADRIVRMGLRMVADHCTKTLLSTTLLRRMATCVQQGIVLREIALILDDDHF
ncbi:hypothetical protein PMAYCL1PPCAC_30919, partial [Pristionchus mayeri]